MKKIGILIITIIIIYLIYNSCNVNKINYISLTDGVLVNYNDYIKKYLVKNNKLGGFNTNFSTLSISSLYQDIRSNRTIRENDNDYFIKKVLRESDLVVISVGMMELSNNYDKYDMSKNKEYFNKMYLNIQKTIIEIKKYTYGKVIFLGYYNPSNYYDSKVDELFYDMDIKLNRLMINNEVIYINLYELVKGNDYKFKDSIYLNNLFYKKIANSINYYIE